MTDDYRTAPAQSLQPRSRAHDDFDDDVRDAIERFQRLNANQKARYVDYLTKVFQDSGWVRNPDKKGKNIPEEQTDWPTVARFLADEEEDLDIVLEDAGFTDEAKSQCRGIFHSAVRDKLGQILNSVLGECTINPFIDNEGLDLVEALALRAEWLQDQLDEACAIKEELNAEINETLGKGNLVFEETADGLIVTEAPKPERSRKQSTVNELMCESDYDTNHDALYNTQTLPNRTMQFYLDRFFRDEG